MMKTFRNPGATPCMSSSSDPKSRDTGLKCLDGDATAVLSYSEHQTHAPGPVRPPTKIAIAGDHLVKKRDRDIGSLTRRFNALSMQEDLSNGTFDLDSRYREIGYDLEETIPKSLRTYIMRDDKWRERLLNVNERRILRGKNPYSVKDILAKPLTEYELRKFKQRQHLDDWAYADPKQVEGIREAIKTKRRQLKMALHLQRQNSKRKWQQERKVISPPLLDVEEEKTTPAEQPYRINKADLRARRKLHKELDKAMRDKKRNTKKANRVKTESLEVSKVEEIPKYKYTKADLRFMQAFAPMFGAFTTVSLSIDLVKDILEATGLKAVWDVLGTQVYGEIDVAQIMIAIVGFCTQLARAQSQIDVGIAISQLQIGLGVPIGGRAILLSSFLASFPMRLFLKNSAETTPVIKTESDLKDLRPSEFVSLLANNLGMLLTSDMTLSLKKIVLAAVSFKLFDKDLSKQLVMALGAPEKMSMLDFVSHSLESLVSILKVYEAIRYDGVTIHAALFAGDPLQELHDQVIELLDYKDRLYTGLPVAGKMCQKEYLSKVRTHLAFANVLKKQYSPLNPKYKRAAKLALMLTVAERDVLQQIHGRRRHAPFGVVIHGPPRIGKSKILPYIAYVWSGVKGRTFDDGQIYSKMKNSDYWDGHDPPSQPFIHISEVGRKAESLIRTQGDEDVDEITTLMDSLPMLLNVAFEGKGKVPACPEMVLIDTNNPGMGIKTVLTNSAAVEGRFLYIEVRVKNEFLKADGCGIDNLKSMSSTKDPMDRWTYRVVKKHPIDNRRTHEEVLMNHGPDDDTMKLTLVLRSLFEKHIKSEQAIHDLYVSGDAYKNIYNAALGIEPEVSEIATESLWRPKSYFTYTSEYYSTAVKDTYDYVATTCDMAVNLLSLFMIYAFTCGLEKASPYCNAFNTKSRKTRATWVIPVLLLFRLFISMTWFKALLIAFAAYFCNIPELLSSYMSIELAVRKKICYERLKTQGCKLLRFTGIFDSSNVFWNPTLIVGVSTFGAIVGAVITFSIAFKAFFKSKQTIHSEGSSIFYAESPYNAEINELEEGYHCGNSYTRIKIKENKVWNTQMPIANVVHTGTVRQLYTSLGSSIRRCIVKSDHSIETYIFGVCSDLALINVHSFAGKIDGSEVCVSNTGLIEHPESTWTRTLIEENKCVRVGADLLLFRVSSFRFRDRTKFFSEPHELLDAAKACVGGEETRAYKGVTPITMEDKFLGPIVLRDYWKYKWTAHRSGVCGTPVVIALGNGAAICGIHSAGGTKDSMAYCEYVSRSQILNAIKAFEEMRDTLPIMSEGKITRITEEPCVKSPFRYEFLPGLEYYGKLPGEIMLNNSSRLRPTPFHSQMAEKLFDEFGFISKENYGPPIMKPFSRKGGEYISPYNVALRAMVKDTPSMDPKVLRKVKNILVSRFVNGLKERGVTHLRPLTMEAAINGVKHDPYLRRVNCSTSAGFGWEGSKDRYLPITDEDMDRITREPVEDLKKRLLEILKSYEDGETANFIYTAQLKDEPRAREKIKAGKTRVFYMTPLEALILNRMFLYPFYSLLMEFRDLFCTGVGIDTHRAHDFVKELFEFSELWIELDVRHFDLSVPFDIHLIARSIVYEVLKLMGYTKRALKIVAGLLTDNLFIYICLNMDLFRVAGMQPSGKYATAEDNSIVLLCILLYVWLSLRETQNKDFFENVEPRTYGDDLLAAVKAAIAAFYNNVTISRFCREKLGMVFTDSNKGEVTIPTISMHNASFLKRSFVLRDGLWIMPLDLESFTKMMMWYIPSKSVTTEKQMSDTCTSCLHEMYFHVGQVAYERWRNTLARWMEEYYDVPRNESLILFPTWHQLNNEFIEFYRTSPMELPPNDVPSSIDVWEEDVSVVTESKNVDTTLDANSTISSQVATVSVDPATTTRHAEFEEKEEEYESEPLSLKSPISGEMPLRSLEMHAEARIAELNDKLLEYTDYNGNPLAHKVMRHIRNAPKPPQAYRDIVNITAEIEDWKSTLKSLKRLEVKSGFIKTESKVVSSEASTGAVSMSSVKTNQNLTDVVGTEEIQVDKSKILPSVTGETNLLSVSDFFSRPVPIDTFAVAVGASLDYSIAVWDVLTLQPSVRAKLRNYAYLKANLHVRIAISGTPFHSGKMLVSYQPYPERNDALQDTLTNYATEAGYRPLLLNYLSQSPECAVMDVKSNQPVDIVCPFISPNPMHRLFNVSAAVLSDVTSYADLEHAGSLYIYSLNVLKSVSATASGIRFYLYAWLTDVELGAPTGTQIDIATESRVIDEREKGPVEKVSTAVADVAAKLETVPQIGPFAKASSMVMRGIASLSAAMGWSVPPTISPPVYVKNQPFMNGAQTIGEYTGKRVTLDPKQELTVDGRATGTDTDDLQICRIASIETFLRTFEWAPTDLPLGANIFIVPVTPNLNTVFEKLTTWWVQPTAMSFAAQPFQWWRGEIHFKFEIVASQFHRGKLAFYYEPNCAQYALIDAALDTNKQYVKVVDIQETQMVEFSVQWAFHRPWCRNALSFSVFPYDSLTIADFYEAANGYIGVVPFTTIQSPDDSTVDINVYVSCPDLHVNTLYQDSIPSQRILTESRVIQFGEPCTHMPLNLSSAKMDTINSEHFGEAPLSYRGILKRYNTIQTVTTTGVNAVISNYTYTSNIYPDPTPLIGVGSATVEPNIYGYLRYAYLGVKGGVRYRIIPQGNTTNSVNETWRVSLLSPTNANVTPAVVASSTNNLSRCIPNGTVTFLARTNGGVEFELPLYTTNKFLFSFASNLVGTNATDEMCTIWTRTFQAIMTTYTTSAATTIAFTVDFATGEDFTFMRFQGAPYFSHT